MDSSMPQPWTNTDTTHIHFYVFRSLKTTGIQLQIRFKIVGQRTLGKAFLKNSILHIMKRDSEASILGQRQNVQLQ